MNWLYAGRTYFYNVGVEDLIMCKKGGRNMKITWIGQAGILFDFDGTTVIVDLYLSNSVFKVNPQNDRRIPVKEDLFEIRPDILVLTHNHLDHTDPETLEKIFERHSGISVLASKNAWDTVRQYGGHNNYVCFNRGTVWTEKGIRFEAVKAEHSDASAIGVLLTYQGQCFYITGDTLFNRDIFRDLPQKIDVVFLPINGVGNNMNMMDAAEFAKKIGAKKVVPIHFGMFDNINPQTFDCENCIIPEIYEEIKV